MSKLGRNYRRLVVASAASNLGDGVAQVAYPWLASAVTRNPLLIALIAVAQKVPWLVVTLPAGVLADRVERRRLMVIANTARAVLTMGVGIAVLGFGGDLPSAAAIDTVVGTDYVLYAVLVVASLLLGVGEVIHDNAGQSFLPRIVEPAALERANGRLYSVELVSNQFAGPPLGQALLAIGFAVPFFFDAGTFAFSAALVATIVPPAALRAAAPTAADDRARAQTSWRRFRGDIAEGFGWLWRHPFLRDLAIILGVLNLLANMSIATVVLFAQEVLGTNPTEFALLLAIGAVGGFLAGWLAGPIVDRLPAGVVLRTALIVFTTVSLVIGALDGWVLVAVLLAADMFVGALWNVVTVSLRQTIIPDRLLGRVNSVYRFFGWGMIPVGALLGGVVVAFTDVFASRELALRMPWFASGVIYAAFTALFAFRRLSSAAVATARGGASPPV